ncbi:MAG: DNA replication/repair protein RecF [Aeriscardovia sp.]|nr:DNA replication/repair protein RecF [Aeriscardovia sp.]
MRIERLALKNYRSWKGLLLDPAPGVNVIYGPNGSGKTNIVESICLLASGSSGRGRLSLQVLHGAGEADVKARISSFDEESRILEAAIKSGRLFVREDGGKWGSFSSLPPLSAVSFSPSDLLLCSSAEKRRSLLDEACFQSMPAYRAQRGAFLKVLSQKSSLLKKIREEAGVGRSELFSALRAFNFQFSSLAFSITRSRAKASKEIASLFSLSYKRFSGLEAGMEYLPSLSEALQEDGLEKVQKRLEERAGAEIASGFPLLGPQRDDFSLSLEGFPLSEVASGGQAWMASLSLRMAQFESLKDLGPVLVLDDVFAQLDPERRAAILSSLPSSTQVFITAAGREDVPEEGGWNGIPIELLRQKAFLP